jgi:hypothetical protein
VATGGIFFAIPDFATSVPPHCHDRPPRLIGNVQRGDVMNDFWMSFWAKPASTIAIGLVTGTIAYATFGTMTAGAVGFGTPSGLWIGFEIIRLGGATLVIDLVSAILEGLGDLG